VPFERVPAEQPARPEQPLRDLAAACAGCSTFAVTAEAGTGRTPVGQTYDMPAFHQDYLTLLCLAVAAASWSYVRRHRRCRPERAGPP
jgi:hypothetical protein